MGVDPHCIELIEAIRAATSAGLHLVCLAGQSKTGPAAWHSYGTVFVNMSKHIGDDVRANATIATLQAITQNCNS